MHTAFDSQSDSFERSSESEEGHSSYAIRQTPLQQLISLNVTIFNDLGIAVTADHFSQDPLEDEEDMPNGDDDSEQSEIDYGESQEEPFEEEEAVEDSAEFVLEEDDVNSRVQEPSFIRYRREWLDELSPEESNESPFFAGLFHQDPPGERGLTIEEIRRIPTMDWSHPHNLFNRGEKCAVCLQDFQLGNTLRVMGCLHRYHRECLDQWLAFRASCPSCRSPHHHHAYSS